MKILKIRVVTIPLHTKSNFLLERWSDKFYASMIFIHVLSDFLFFCDNFVNAKFLIHVKEKI